MQKLLENLEKIKIVRPDDKKPDFLKQMPETPGIYVYFSDKTVIYIGKAINLKKRVSSYFDLDLDIKTAKMISEASHISYIQVTSELEALLLEAKLIRLYMPHYNIAAKDDKHPLYILITKDKYPRVITARKADLKLIKTIAIYGPFPSSGSVRMVLRFIRRIFPFADHNLGKRGCLYSHIGLCNPCPNIIEYGEGGTKTELRKNYLKNIRNIKSILDGKIEQVSADLIKEMFSFSKNEDYEQAIAIRNKINNLEYITKPQMPVESYLENPNLYEDQRLKELKELKILINANSNFQIAELGRIECFDNAHLSGTNATASMVTFINAEADKKFYRHFKIRKAKGGDDYESMREVARRRAKHFVDWGKPDLIIVDGGVGQIKAFAPEIHRENPGIIVVGVAKHPDRLIIDRENREIVKIRLTGAALNLVSRMRDEAHRFARRLHHKLVSKAIRNPDNIN